MTRMKASDHAALLALRDADRVVGLTLASVGLLETRNPVIVELRRLAIFGQALLLVEGRARDASIRPSDAAGALRRFVTPTVKEQRAAIDARKVYMPAMRDRQGVLSQAMVASVPPMGADPEELRLAKEVASWLDRFVADPSVESERGLRKALVTASECDETERHVREAARRALAAWDGGAS